MDVTLVIPTLNEAGNIAEVVRRAHALLKELGVSYEILIIDGGSTDATCELARQAGAQCIEQNREQSSYGAALRAGFAHAQGQYIVTMDSDLSHEPEFIETLWKLRDNHDIVIASRYVPGGSADMPRFRWLLSRILNVTFTSLLKIPVKDISSGFRLYRRRAIERMQCEANDFDVLEEILIKLYISGHSVGEVPFDYKPRREGKSHAKLIKFGMAYLRTLRRMMALRRSGAPSEPLS